jgi:hypothetical protein
VHEQEKYEMIHETPRHTHTRRADQDVEHAQAITYLLGTIGVAIVIAVAVIMLHKAGWLQGVQTAIRKIDLPGLPSAPNAGVPDVLAGLGNEVRSVGQSTTTLWQRGGGSRQHVQQPSAADRRD